MLLLLFLIEIVANIYEQRDVTYKPWFLLFHEKSAEVTVTLTFPSSMVTMLPLHKEAARSCSRGPVTLPDLICLTCWRDPPIFFVFKLPLTQGSFKLLSSFQRLEKLNPEIEVPCLLSPGVSVPGEVWYTHFLLNHATSTYRKPQDVRYSRHPRLPDFTDQLLQFSRNWQSFQHSFLPRKNVKEP